jgi:hypothetical protein
LAEVVQKSARLQAELLSKLSERHFASAREPTDAKPSPPTTALPTDGVERSLEKIAKQLETLSRELDRNNSMLGHLVSVHSFYRSILAKPREWRNSLLRIFSRLRLRPRGVS